MHLSFVPKHRETASERFTQRPAEIRARGRPRLEELDTAFEFRDILEEFAGEFKAAGAAEADLPAGEGRSSLFPNPAAPPAVLDRFPSTSHVRQTLE